MSNKDTEVRTQKYSDRQYVDMEYFVDDETISNHSQKIVTTRKEHTCTSIYRDPHPIPSGSQALCESAIDVDRGRVSNYLCLPCCDEYLEERYDEDELEQENEQQRQ